jgi:Tol biopolymer transport system component
MSLLRGTLALVVMALAVPAASHAAFPGSNGRIAFYYEGTGGLWTVNPDGSDFAEVISDTGRWIGPNWSKDGKWLAVGIDDPQAGTTDIWILEFDGVGIEQLTTSGRATSPSWSPDGTEIAFSCLHEENPVPQGIDGEEICVVNVGTKAVRMLTDPSDGVLGYFPTWSPQGDVIVFSGGHTVEVDGEEEPHVDLFAVAPTGGQITNLTPDALQEDFPDFSPDGTMLAFMLNTTEFPGPGGVGIVGASGGVGTYVTDVRGDLHPAWSPDGTKIAFSRFVAGVSQIMVVDKGGGQPVQITDAPYHCFHPDWQSIQTALTASLVVTPGSIGVGDHLTVTMTARNGTGEDLTDVQPAGPLTLEGEGQAELVSGPAPASVATLGAGESQPFVYELDATAVGTLVVKGRVQAKTPEGDTVTATARCGGEGAALRVRAGVAADEPAPPVCRIDGGAEVEILPCTIELVDISPPRDLDRLGGDHAPPPGTNTPPGGT